MFLVHLKKLTITFQVSEILMRGTKELHFLKYCSHQIKKKYSKHSSI